MLNRVILPMIASGCVAINLIAAEIPGETSIREILRAQNRSLEPRGWHGMGKGIY
jgi:hypothetical protein